MIRAKNEKDLLSILRVISSEAVDLSKKRINENADPTLSKFMKQRTKDESVYGELVAEQEDAELEEPPEEETVEEEPPEEPPEKAPEEDSSSETGEIGASFDSVVKAVNNLRAGKSLRDSSIKQQAQVYYDKLTEDERTTMLVFLNALSEIIAGQVDGKDAQDPSDPPSSINISSDKESPTEETSSEEPTSDVAADEEPSSEEPPEESEEEDTTPPIKVNESQDLSAIRRKIRRMMLRG
jgi:hypothetical protein